MNEQKPESLDDGRTKQLKPLEDGATQRLDAETLEQLSRNEAPEGTVSQTPTAPAEPAPVMPEAAAPESVAAPDTESAANSPSAADASSDAAPAEDEKKDEEPFVVEHVGTPEADAIKEEVVAILKTVFDPEIPVNIYELGMVYDIFVDADARTLVRMTLTSPNCPVAGTLPGEVEDKVRSVESVSEAKVDLVWDPAWTPDFMTEAAKLQLNMF